MRITDAVDNGSVIRISIVPTGRALGFTHSLPREDRVVPSTSEIENRITALLGGIAANTVLGTDDDTSQCSSAEYALHLAEKACDNQSHDWRRTNPTQATTLVERCLEKAKQLVRQNEARIRQVAAVLVERGSMTGPELAAI
jgi:cell division protease FtsH